MQFRHALVPYLYTMARRNEIEGLPLVCPLYYDWPGEDEAYEKTGQYLFGTQLMAAPVTTPIDRMSASLARKSGSLPENGSISLPAIAFSAGEKRFAITRLRKCRSSHARAQLFHSREM